MSAALDMALDRYRAVRVQLRDVFFELSGDPERYCDQRDRIDSLDLERLSAATVLGELIGSTAANGQRVLIEDPPAPPREPSLTACAPDPSEEPPPVCCAEPIDEPADTAAEPAREPVTHPSRDTEATPANAEQVAAFRASFDVANVRIAPAPVANAVREAHVSRQFAISLGRPSELALDADRLGEIELLEMTTATERLAPLLALPADSLKLIIECLAARVRSAQIGLVGVPAWAARLDAVFRAIASLRADHCDRYVYGLSRQHAPRHGTWLADARTLHDALVEDAPSGTRAATDSPTRPPSRRRDEAAEALTPNEKESGAAIPESWPHWPLVEEKRAVMFGADPREAARLVLQEGLRLGELEWIDADKPRAVESLVERIRAGSVGVVFVNKFVSHNGTNQVLKAAKRAKILAIVIRQGYGINAVREAIDHARGRAGGAASSAGA